MPLLLGENELAPRRRIWSPCCGRTLNVPSRCDAAGRSESGDLDDPPSGGKRLDRILVATDGSATSEHAIRFAVELASEYQSEVLLVHVIAIPHEPTEHDQGVLKDGAALAGEHGVPANSTLLVGSAAAEIVAFAESHDVNMIVVGSRREHPMAGTLLGSVSLGVLRASGRPLVIVDGEESITYCANGSCRDVRMYGHSDTGEASSPVRSPGPKTSGVSGATFMTSTERFQSRAASPVPQGGAQSTNTGPSPHRPWSGTASGRDRAESVTGRSHSLLGLLSGAIRLEAVVFVGDDAWAITATIPYEGVVMVAEFATRNSASDWFVIADTLARS